MTYEQINLAIHKAVGFEWNDERRLWERHANKARVVSHQPFNYASDLNLMHEAEATLDEDCRNGFRLELLNVTDSKHFGGFGHIHATACQRAEAFLRTLGKWEEVQQ